MIGGHSGCPEATIPIRAVGVVGVVELLLHALSAAAHAKRHTNLANRVVFMMGRLLL